MTIMCSALKGNSTPCPKRHGQCDVFGSLCALTLKGRNVSYRAQIGPDGNRHEWDDANAILVQDSLISLRGQNIFRGFIIDDDDLSLLGCKR